MEKVSFHDIVNPLEWEDVYFRLGVLSDVININVVEDSKSFFVCAILILTIYTS